MSATHTLQPQDSAALLQASAGMARYSLRNDPRSFTDAKRDLVRAMERQSLLLAHSDGAPARISGPQAGLLAAFTDEEAASAWKNGLLSRAPAYEFVLAPAEWPRTERDGRKLWLELFERHDAKAVSVNPAGPQAFLAYDWECRGARPRLLRKRTEPSGEAWLDVTERQAERVRVSERLRVLEAVLAADDGRDYIQLRDEPPGLNRIGSLSVGAAEGLLNGSWLLAQGETRKGMQTFLFGAYAWGRYAADPHRCVDALLQGGELLLELHDQDAGEEQQRWIREYLSELANALALMNLDYRQDEAQRFTRWRTPANGGS